MDINKFNRLVKNIVDMSLKEDDLSQLKSSESIIMIACLHHYYAWIKDGEDSMDKAIKYLGALKGILT